MCWLSRPLFSFAVALSLQAMPALCQQIDEQNFVNVPLPTWFEFTVGDHPKAFSFSLDNQTDYVLATWDESSGLQVTIPRGTVGGLGFKPRLDLAPPRLLVADLDGDSKAEILVCSDKLRIFRVRADGLSLIWTSREMFDGNHSPNLGLCDFDDDGHLDIAVLDSPTEKLTEKKSLYLYLNQNENLQFSLSGATLITDAKGFHSSYGLAIGDFSGDDRPDIVVGSSSSEWMWLFEIENGNPMVKQMWKAPSGGLIGPGLGIGNMVAGGKQELLVGTVEGDLFVYEFPAEGTPKVIAKATAGPLATSVQAADMDGDGLDEFLLARGLRGGVIPTKEGLVKLAEKDVATEIWQLKEGQLTNIWRKEATGFSAPRLLLQDLDQDGTPEFVTYSLNGRGKAIEAFRPVLTP